MSYGGSNPPLCTIFSAEDDLCCEESSMEMNPAGEGRMIVALVALALLAVLVWWTMEPGKLQQLSWLLLGFFAFRVVMTWRRSR